MFRTVSEAIARMTSEIIQSSFLSKFILESGVGRLKTLLHRKTGSDRQGKGTDGESVVRTAIVNFCLPKESTLATRSTHWLSKASSGFQRDIAQLWVTLVEVPRWDSEGVCCMPV